MHSIRVFIAAFRDLWRKWRPSLKAVWDSHIVAWLLILTSVVYALRWIVHTPAPGYAVAVITVIAAAISVRDNAPSEKLAWLLIIACLLRVEFKAIRFDRDANAREQAERFAEQQKEFGRIADRVDTSITKIDGSITKSDSHFSKAARQASGILAAAQKSESLAGNALDQITGAGSYPFIVPETQLHDRVIPLTVYAVGKNMLTNVTVTFHHLVGKQSDPLEFNLAPGISVGVVHSSYPKKLSQPIVPRLEPGQDTDSYDADIYTQTKIYYEEIFFRKVPNGHGWIATYFLSEIHAPMPGGAEKLKENGVSHLVCISHGFPLGADGQLASSMRNVPFCGE